MLLGGANEQTVCCRSARSTFSRPPLLTRLVHCGSKSTVFINVAFSEAAERLGFWAASSAAAPATWDEFLASAKKIVDSGAAPWGATFDCHGWRSLAPVTHSMSSQVYTSEGLFDFTSEPAIEALKLMKNIMAYANPDILLEGASDAGVNGTPDEVAFATQRVGLYFKYFNAPLRMAASCLSVISSPPGTPST